MFYRGQPIDEYIGSVKVAYKWIEQSVYKLRLTCKLHSTDHLVSTFTYSEPVLNAGSRVCMNIFHIN